MQHPLSTPQRVWWFPAVVLALVVALTWMPVVAAGVSAATTEENQTVRSPVSSVQVNDTTPSDLAPKVAEPDAQTASTLAQTIAKRTAPVPKRKPQAKGVATRTASRPAAAKTSRVRRTHTRKAAAKSAAYAVRTTSASRTSTSAPKKKASSSVPAKSGGSDSSNGDELSQARAILASLVAQHPILAGTTVSIGSTPGGYQAVAYFKSGRILISPNHKASLRTILRHEIWHVIDWRDNNHIDWGENIPPK